MLTREYFCPQVLRHTLTASWKPTGGQANFVRSSLGRKYPESGEDEPAQDKGNDPARSRDLPDT
jgi:hypothetical protein